MPLDATAVEPISPDQPVSPTPTDETVQTPPETPQDTTGEGHGISEELLRVPAVAALLAGTPPAWSAKIKGSENSPVTKLIEENKDALMGAGIRFYKSLSGSLAVVFNAMQIHPEQIKQADKVGKLLEVAPPVDQVNHAISKSGPGDEVFIAQGSQAPAGAPPVNPPQSAQAPMPPPASAQRNAMAQRLKMLQPQPATAGPLAGRGNLLKGIFKPVI